MGSGNAKVSSLPGFRHCHQVCFAFKGSYNPEQKLVEVIWDDKVLPRLTCMLRHNTSNVMCVACLSRLDGGFLKMG